MPVFSPTAYEQPWKYYRPLDVSPILMLTSIKMARGMLCWQFASGVHDVHDEYPLRHVFVDFVGVSIFLRIR